MMLNTSEVLDLSKENVQPLRQGRKAAHLKTALQAQNDPETHHRLLKQREEYEYLIRTYEGDDPLEPYWNYVLWLEQSFTKSNRDGNLIPLLEDILIKFKDNDKYKQDQRFILLLIKYINSQSNPIELYQHAHNQGLGTMCSVLYKAWAEELDKNNDFKRANQIYELGIQCRSQPLQDLKEAHVQFQLSIAKRMLDGNLNNTEQDTENPMRTALSKLQPSKVKTTRISKDTAGVFQQTSKNLESKNNGVNMGKFKVYQEDDENFTKSDFKRNEKLPKGTISERENIMKASKWCGQKQRQSTFKSSATPSFEIHEDPDAQCDTIKTVTRPRALNLRKEEFKCPVAVFEDPDPTKKSMYPKHLVYVGGRDIQLEELFAVRYWRKVEKENNITLPEDKLQVHDILTNTEPLEVHKPLQTDLTAWKPFTDEHKTESTVRTSLQTDSMSWKPFTDEPKTESTVRASLQTDSMSWKPFTDKPKTESTVRASLQTDLTTWKPFIDEPKTESTARASLQTDSMSWKPFTDEPKTESTVRASLRTDSMSWKPFTDEPKTKPEVRASLQADSKAWKPFTDEFQLNKSLQVNKEVNKPQAIESRKYDSLYTEREVEPEVFKFAQSEPEQLELKNFPYDKTDVKQDSAQPVLKTSDIDIFASSDKVNASVFCSPSTSFTVNTRAAMNVIQEMWASPLSHPSAKRQKSTNGFDDCLFKMPPAPKINQVDDFLSIPFTNLDIRPQPMDDDELLLRKSDENKENPPLPLIIPVNLEDPPLEPENKENYPPKDYSTPTERRPLSGILTPATDVAFKEIDSGESEEDDENCKIYKANDFDEETCTTKAFAVPLPSSTPFIGRLSHSRKSLVYNGSYISDDNNTAKSQNTSKYINGQNLSLILENSKEQGSNSAGSSTNSAINKFIHNIDL